jgi:hypothetical protein
VASKTRLIAPPPLVFETKPPGVLIKEGKQGDNMKQVYEKINNNKLRCKNCLYFSQASNFQYYFEIKLRKAKSGNCINTDKIREDCKQDWSHHEGATVGIQRFESHFGCKFFIWRD